MTINSKICGEIHAECGPGWLALIQVAVDSIDAYVGSDFFSKTKKEYADMGIKFDYNQIKEKFGGLRIYCSISDPYVNGIIDMAEKFSFYICEQTGSVGSLHKKGGTYKTVSSEYAVSNGWDPVIRN